MRLILALLASAALTQAATRDLTTYTFGHYLKEFGKIYPESDYETRKAQFESRVAEIIAHNALPGQTYTKGVNHMTDWTDAELKRVLGYKKDLAREHRKQNTVPEFKSTVDVSTLPNSVDWRELGAVSPVKDQGHCGSCWTFAAASTIESHYYLYTGKIQELSQQQIAGCTSNPLHCGGSGGCEGGIAQLAFEGVIKAGGLASEWTYPYISYFGTDFDCVYNATKMGAAATISGYMNVLQNDYASLMDAVANKGPISISVDASSFHSYEKGVYNGCNQDQPDIDHAVQLVGYGTDSAFGDYWLVRNSWGPNWGEDGYIRIARQTDRQLCAVDITPSDGSGCDNGPPNVTVCGTCGILFDNTFPTIM